MAIFPGKCRFSLTQERKPHIIQGSVDFFVETAFCGMMYRAVSISSVKQPRAT